MTEINYLLNEQFVKSNMKKAIGSRFFGQPIESLSRDELMAMAMFWEEQYRMKKEEMLDCLVSALRR